MTSARSIVVCDGNFCRSQGATLQDFQDVATPVEVEVRTTHCSGVCLFGPVVSVIDARSARVLFQMHGERAQALLDSIRGRRPVDLPSFAP